MYSRYHTCQLWSYPTSVFWFISSGHVIQLVLLTTILFTDEFATTRLFAIQLPTISLVMASFTTMVTLHAGFTTRLHIAKNHGCLTLVPTITILRHLLHVFTLVKGSLVTSISCPIQTLLSPFSKQHSILKRSGPLQYHLRASEGF